MHRLNVCRAVIACSFALAFLGAGCGAPRTGADSGPATEAGYPDWIRIVPEATEDASYFVGAVSLARDVESGIEAAESDALAAAAKEQRAQFIHLFDRATVDSGIETTSEERLEFRTTLADEFSDRLESATSREGVYYRHCLGDDGGERQAVCEAFVLLRLDHVERDRILRESLAALGQRRQERGDEHIALLIEWMLRNL